MHALPQSRAAHSLGTTVAPLWPQHLYPNTSPCPLGQSQDQTNSYDKNHPQCCSETCRPWHSSEKERFGTTHLLRNTTLLFQVPFPPSQLSLQPCSPTCNRKSLGAGTAALCLACTRYPRASPPYTVRVRQCLMSPEPNCYCTYAFAINWQYSVNDRV